jgi:8-oxo-dGTP pyrophosphatase MutT (NUDIX family)
MLDQTVAGGLTHGLSPLECVIKECAEEASIPEELVKDGLRATGAITYVTTAEGGWIQPGTSDEDA